MNQHDEVREILERDMALRKKIAAESFAFLDKALLYLSGGGIVLSVTFLKDIIGDESINNVALLKVTWAMWAATVFFVLLSYRFEQTENHKAIINVYELMKKHGLREVTDPKVIVDSLNQQLADLHSIWGKWISGCNWSGIAAYFLGLFSMVWFAFSNT